MLRSRGHGAARLVLLGDQACWSRRCLAALYARSRCWPSATGSVSTRRLSRAGDKRPLDRPPAKRARYGQCHRRRPTAGPGCTRRRRPPRYSGCKALRFPGPSLRPTALLLGLLLSAGQQRFGLTPEQGTLLQIPEGERRIWTPIAEAFEHLPGLGQLRRPSEWRSRGCYAASKSNLASCCSKGLCGRLARSFRVTPRAFFL
jgi:hypothetical protein